MKISHERLKEALVAATLADLRHVPAEEEIDYTFSGAFEKWAAGLLRQMRGDKRYVSVTGRILRAILIAAIIMALLVGTVMAFPSVREAVKKFFVRREGNMQYIEFYVNDTKPSDSNTTETTQNGSIPDVKDEFTLSMEVEYSTDATINQSGPPIPIEYRFPTYLPDGLKVESEVISPITVSTVMVGPNGLRCTYQQMAQPNGSNINVSVALSSDYVHSEREICGIQVDYFTSEPSITIIWTDEYYLYQLIVNADMPLSEIEKIISSIEPRDDLNHP